MTLSDSSPTANELQIAVLQSKKASERLSLTLLLSETMISLSRRAIKRANPNLSDEEIRCKFVELHYGKALADNFRHYLLRKTNVPVK
mgnify:CR=1 FL=1